MHHRLCGAHGQRCHCGLRRLRKRPTEHGERLLLANHNASPHDRRAGPRREGLPYDMKTIDEVKEANSGGQLLCRLQVTMTNFLELIAAEIMPLRIVSATMEGCMEKV